MQNLLHVPLYLGVQVTADFYGIPYAVLDNTDIIKQLMLQAAKEANTTIINYYFHKFAPQGVSGAIIIAESHLSIHTWPEEGYAAIDIFTCGDKTKPYHAIEYLKDALKPTNIAITETQRGLLK